MRIIVEDYRCCDVGRRTGYRLVTPGRMQQERSVSVRGTVKQRETASAATRWLSADFVADGMPVTGALCGYPASFQLGRNSMHAKELTRR